MFSSPQILDDVDSESVDKLGLCQSLSDYFTKYDPHYCRNFANLETKYFRKLSCWEIHTSPCMSILERYTQSLSCEYFTVVFPKGSHQEGGKIYFACLDNFFHIVGPILG